MPAAEFVVLAAVDFVVLAAVEFVVLAAVEVTLLPVVEFDALPLEVAFDVELFVVEELLDLLASLLVAALVAATGFAGAAAVTGCAWPFAGEADCALGNHQMGPNTMAMAMTAPNRACSHLRWREASCRVWLRAFMLVPLTASARCRRWSRRSRT